jgi:hypothetical protein
VLKGQVAIRLGDGGVVNSPRKDQNERGQRALRTAKISRFIYLHVVPLGFVGTCAMEQVNNRKAGPFAGIASGQIHANRHILSKGLAWHTHVNNLAVVLTGHTLTPDS